jgi:TetR/AcrR family transcriptional repressor of nem operon
MGLDIDQPVNYCLGMTQVHDTKQRLLDTARELFYARSYEDVGVQEICQEAGVKKGSFYHFFPSKRDLTVAMLDESWKQFRETLLADAFVPDITPLERIQRLLDMQYRHHTAVKDKTGHVFGCPFGNLAGEMSTQDEVIRARVKRIFKDLEAPIEAVLEEAVAAGDLPELDSRATASAMVAYLEGLSLMAKTHNDPDIVRQLGPAILGLAVPVGEG